MTTITTASTTPIDTAGNPFQVPVEVTNAIELGPHSYETGMLVISFETDPELAAALLPAPLRPVRAGEMLLSMNTMRATRPSGLVDAAYNEMILSIPAEYAGEEGKYCVQLYIGDREDNGGIYPTLSGFTAFGFPKRETTRFDLDIDPEGGTAAFDVQRAGKPVVQASFRMGDDVPAAKAARSVVDFLLKYSPSIDGASIDALKLNRIVLDLAEPAVARRIEITSGLEAIHLDTGLDLPVRRVLSAVYTDPTMTFAVGETLWDYLAGE